MPAVSRRGETAGAAAGAIWRHPLAEREIRIGEHVVGYALKRVRRRSIGFTVTTQGLSVNAPLRIAAVDLDNALRAKGPWIVRKLAEQQERSLQVEAARVRWGDGATFPFLGKPVVVKLDPGVGAAPG